MLILVFKLLIFKIKRHEALEKLFKKVTQIKCFIFFSKMPLLVYKTNNTKPTAI